MKTTRKTIRKITPILLSAILLTNSMTIPAFAATKQEKQIETGTSKEEVVYVNLNTNGSVQDTYVVNSFAGGDITDYGLYSNTKILNTTDKIKQEGDTITFHSNADKVYYKGELDGAQIPWNISIKYYLNDTEYTEETLAGKKGALKIHLNITQNKACEGDFYKQYALQTNITLDTEKCHDIVAKDATIANVGSKKQLTFTSLPGKGLDAEVTANVENFSMDAIDINGIKMNLNIDIDDKELLDKVNKLVDAVDKVDDGTGKIKDGAGSLKSGTSKVESGAASLKSGADSLNTGVQSLKKGINEMQSGLNELDKKSASLTSGSKKMKDALEELRNALNGVSASAEDIEKLVDASNQIKEGIGQLAEASEALESGANYVAFKSTLKEKGLDLDELKAGNEQAAASLQAMVNRANELESFLERNGISTDKIAPVKQECESLANQMITLLNGNNAAIAAMETYLNALGDGAGKLSNGVQNLQTQYEQFDAAIGKLATTLTGLMQQMQQLKDAVNTLAEEYSKLDSGITAYTNGVNSAATGNKKLVSGAGELSTGTQKLQSGSQSLYNGTAQLVNGVVKLYDATGKLKDGTGKMKKETSGMDKKVEDKIDDMLKEISGDEGEITSFVSNKNTKVQSVQFVIQTQKVEKEEVEVAEKPAPKKGFFQKIKDLF